MDYKQCDVSWCGSSKSECEQCGGDAFTYLEEGERTDCLARWSACTNDKNGCCDGPSGSTCTEKSQGWSQCLPSSNNETPVTAAPTISSTPPPSNAPVTTITTTTPTIPPTRQSSSPSRCGCDSSCTQQVLDSLADGYSCGSRIDWVVSKVGLTESDACKMVGDEYPTICGACDCYSDSSPIPSPIENPPSPPTPGDIAPSSSQNDIEWDGSDLVLTHYWDCSGQSCDATTLSPWNYDEYRSPSGYSPQDPNDFGGPSSYGEKLWVTAAIMNIDQGSDDGCCGSTSEGGCGNCILIQNPDSLHPDWSVMAMKKNTCGSCGSSKHADINVPGFDVLQYSLANICGDEPNTGLTKDQSTILGEWYKTHSNTADAGAELCGFLPEAYQKGCSIFSDWGWTGGKTSRARYKVVDCPQQFKTFVGSLFDEDGVID